MADSASRDVDLEAALGSAGTDPGAADLAVSILGRLFRLATQLTDLQDLGARDYGMGFARGRVLWALQESGPVVMRALSQRLGISPRTVTGLIDALEADGWVTRTPHPEDRRATIVAITAAAETALTSLRDSYESLAHDLLADIPQADLARCWSVLTTIQDRLGDVVARRMAATPPPGPRPLGDPPAEKATPSQLGSPSQCGVGSGPYVATVKVSLARRPTVIAGQTRQPPLQRGRFVAFTAVCPA